MKDLIFSVFPSENFVDLGLYQFGWERCKPAHSFGPAARNHYLFHYIMSGTGRLMTTDENGQTQSFSIKSRQGFMIFPNQITTYIAHHSHGCSFSHLLKHIYQTLSPQRSSLKTQ